MAGRTNRATAAIALLVIALLGVLVLPRASAAQDAGVMRGLDLETAGRYRDAAVAFRAGVRGPESVTALLGLERVYASLGWTDSLLPLLDTLIAAHPDDAMTRSVQLRALMMAGHDERAREAFARWSGMTPRDPQPYRDYARLLMDGGRTHAADTVLQGAIAALGSGRDVALELAQLRGQLGLWALSAQSWREALGEASYLQQAAAMALQGTPPASRDSVREALAQPPVEPAPRRALARLELGWGDADRAWQALAPLAPTDSAVDAWIAFAEEAEAIGAFGASMQALTAAHRHRPSPIVAARAAIAALDVGRPADALALTELAAGDDSSATLLLPLRVRALSLLDRPAEAERLVGEVVSRDPMLAPPLYRQLAWAWVRAGELDRARAALARGDADPADEVFGWLALYAGDLRGARASLRATAEGGGDVVAAAALLGRTRADSAPAAGAAFLALARGDSAAAAASFERAAPAVGDAAPLMLAMAARLHLALGEPDRAIALWSTIVTSHPTSPEAVEAELAWARELRRRGDQAAAAARLEHLILTHPGSALVPQARRELDLLRGAVPPAGEGASRPPDPSRR